MKTFLRNGNCLDLLRTLPDNCVDSIVTDPPYGLSFMGKKWDYDVPSAEIWAECLRVLKPGGHLLAFAGTRTQHRMAVRIEDAGFEIRDMIAWVYGSGFPKSKNLDGDWRGWGTALKPALEPITVARKPLVGTVAANVLAHGTGALNIDACRVPTASDVDAKGYADKCASVVGLGSNRNGAAYGEWTGERQDSASPLGRWPANLIHSGEPEVLAGFPEAGGGFGKRGASTKTYGGGMGFTAATMETVGYGDTGSAARFFYCAKAAKKDRGEGNSHPTVKPTDLMRYLCRLVTPPGGTVLDPFMGSGSTGKAALLEGFNFMGFELDADYFAIAKARLAATKPARKGEEPA